MKNNILSAKIPLPARLLAGGIRLLESWKLTSHAGKRQKIGKGLADYINRSVCKGETVFEIGTSPGDYLHLITEKLQGTGQVISFKSQEWLYHNLVKLVNIMGWKNVKPEFIQLAKEEAGWYREEAKELPENQGFCAKVVNIDERKNTHSPLTLQLQTVDGYCAENNVWPQFLNIDADGNELAILTGAVQTLKASKPAILLHCEERIVGEERVLETFRLLEQLGYRGCFILDNMQIPLLNFTFQVYQNPCKDFYCSHFLFE